MALDRGLSKLERHFFYLYRPLEQLRASDDPDALLSEWRRTEKHSQERRNALFYDQAVDGIAEALCLPRNEAEALVREYIEATEANEAAV